LKPLGEEKGRKVKYLGVPAAKKRGGMKKRRGRARITKGRKVKEEGQPETLH